MALVVPEIDHTMKAIVAKIGAVLLAVAAIATARLSADTIKFQRSLEDAQQSAKSKRPIVILFEAPWCGWCRKMATDTLTDSSVQAASGKFLWVKIDVDKEPELAARFGVEGVPVTVVLDSEGRLLGSRGGFIAPEKFVEFLTTSLANPHPEELVSDQLARFAKAATAQDERELATRLVEQLARPSRQDRREILAAFKEKGPSSWPVLLALMGDSRLSIRAAAAGTLKHVSTADLPFHPFAEPALRQQQVAVWQKWLDSHPGSR